MCDCFKTNKFLYFMVAIIIISNLILYIWNKWWRSRIEYFGGTSSEILQLRKDLQSIDDQLQEYDESVKSYIVNMGLKSLSDVNNTQIEIENDNKKMEDLNNKLSLGGLLENDAYAELTGNLNFNLEKLEDTTGDLKETMVKL